MPTGPSCSHAKNCRSVSVDAGVEFIANPTTVAALSSGSAGFSSRAVPPLPAVVALTNFISSASAAMAFEVISHPNNLALMVDVVAICHRSPDAETVADSIGA